MTGSNKLTLLTRKRRVIDTKSHLQSRFIHPNQRQCQRIIRSRDSFPNVGIDKTRHRHDITHRSFRQFNAFQSLKTKQLGNLIFDHRSIFLDQRRHLPHLNLTIVDFANDNAPQIFGIVQRGHLQLQRLIDITRRGWHMAQDGFKQALHIFVLILQLLLGIPRQTRSKQVGEIALILVRP